MKLKNMDFKVATYLRLSKDDGDFSLSGKTESNSIHNQRELLTSYLKAHPELMFVDEYVDDGYTGTNFDRPDFQRMMDDIKTGKINCIIVKDLSRFGREYIGAGRYIEKIFPQLGVRFIAVNDNFDTYDSNSADNIVVPFKNLINDSYSRDTSIKVRSNLEVKRQNGEFVAPFAVYGYSKDPANKNHLVVDEYAAEIVKEIFFLAMDGLSPIGIAKHLNKKGVLSPLEYKKANGSRFNCSFVTNQKSLWSHVSVRRILQNEIYTGVLLQGKTTTPNYKVKKVIKKDKEDWSRNEGTHEAIISKSFFDLIQILLREDTRSAPDSSKIYPYSGKIFCGDCKQPLIRKTTKSAGKSYVYYVCSANKADKTVCSNHSIALDKLDCAILASIQAEISTIMDMELAMQQIEQLAWEKSELRKIDAGIAVQEELIQKNSQLRMGIYEDLCAGILDRDEFVELKKEFTQRIADAKGAIEELTVVRNSVLQGVSSQQGWIAQFKEYENITEINRNAIVNLIEKIYVYEGNEIEVVFRHRNQLNDIMEFLQQKKPVPVQRPALTVLEREVI